MSHVLELTVFLTAVVELLLTVALLIEYKVLHEEHTKIHSYG